MRALAMILTIISWTLGVIKSAKAREVLVLTFMILLRS